MPRLYGRRWAKARAQFLGQHPWCVMCEQEGRQRRANVVDHITPHEGDPVLFWDVNNWQPLCKTHHDAAKQAQEKTGHIRGCDEDGTPFDPNHHWSEST